jgi:hypothetical protein
LKPATPSRISFFAYAFRWQTALPFLIPLVCFPLYLAPLWDSDFWWHLAMGRAIVESGGISDFDQLGVYTFAVGNLRASIIQNGYWLSQLVYFTIHSLAGVDGVIWLRGAAIAATVGLVAWRTASSGIGTLGQIFIGIAVGVALAGFAADRPATFSYLGFAAFSILLSPDSIRLTVKRFLAVGLVLLIWANMHGSVALAAFLLVLLAVLVAATPIFGMSEGHFSSRLMSAGALLCLALVSVLTPNGFDLYRGVVGFEGGEIQARTSEYMTPWAVTTQLGVPLTGYWFLLLISPLAGYGLISRRSFGALLKLSALVIISLTAYRYVPYFLIGGAPLLASGLAAARTMLSVRLAHAASLSALIAIGAITALAIPQYATAKFGVNDKRFPVSAANFVQSRWSNNGQAIFNHYNWGGFLTYRFEGRHKVFIDGRNLDEARFAAYTEILWATPVGRQLLERDIFSLIIVPERSLTGESYAIIAYLSRHPRWVLRYRDAVAFVFERVGSVAQRSSPS